MATASGNIDKLNQISKRLDANIIGKLTYLPRCMGSKIATKENSILVNTGIPCDMFNVACLTDCGADLKSIANFFSNLPFAWWVGFGNNLEKYRSKLEKFGLKNPEIESGMYADITKISGVSDCGILSTFQVTDLRSLQDFIEVYKKLIPADAKAIEQFYLSASPFILKNNSPLKLFVGYVDHQPAATAALFLHADVAGIWDVTTLPDFRKVGIATSMVRRALFYAHDKHNYRTGILTATESGEEIYQKLGFQKIKEFFVFNVST